MTDDGKEEMVNSTGCILNKAWMCQQQCVHDSNTSLRAIKSVLVSCSEDRHKASLVLLRPCVSVSKNLRCCFDIVSCGLQVVIRSIRSS
eukprot:3247-Heterococcus_DN1.PRE.4